MILPQIMGKERIADQLAEQLASTSLKCMCV